MVHRLSTLYECTSGLYRSQIMSAYSSGYTNFDGELGTAHHFNDVEVCPAIVIAHHL